MHRIQELVHQMKLVVLSALSAIVKDQLCLHRQVVDSWAVDRLDHTLVEA